ncbi:scaffoldin [Piromyces finnis]|uniref:Scaffoldin n=1 Tax=Piromyces finnis TaxID=1754191 RepID=A0A1Y1UXD8_9FUNG|nr:scaffoldin [Piromyces finnis]|eukprot:ORX42352.1 scaffoldin [Piromyces finnis]
MFPKLKRIPLTLLTLASLIKVISATSETELKTCDNNLSIPDSPQSCSGTLSGKFCIKDSVIYGSSTSVCKLTTDGDYLFKDDGETLITSVSSGTKGLLYTISSEEAEQTTENNILVTISNKNYLFVCDSESKICTESSKEGYYLTGDSGSSAKLYYCDSSKACSTKTGLLDGFYPKGPIVNSGYTSLIQCSSTKCEELEEVQADSFYPCGTGAVSGTPIKYKKLLSCSGSDTVTCSELATNNIGYYLNGNGYSEGFISLIYCSSATECTEFSKGKKNAFYINAKKASEVIGYNGTKFSSAAGVTTAGSAYIDGGSIPDGEEAEAANVISCVGGTCISIPKGNASTDLSTGFLNANEEDTDNEIILCNGTSCVGDPGPNDAGQAVVDGSNLNSLIIYDGTDIVSLPTPSTLDGHVYIDYASGTEEVFKNIIRCESTGCTVSAGVDGSETGQAYIDAITNANIIKCTDADGCTSAENETEGSAYIDALKSSNVILCNESACTSSEGISTPGYGYLDKATEGNIIVCKSANNVTTCSSIANGGSETSPVGFIDASVNDGKTIIVCSGAEDSPCTSSETEVTQGQAFIDGTSIVGETFTNVIVADATAGTFSALAAADKKPNTTPGYVYIDASIEGAANVIQCTLEGSAVTCTSAANEAVAGFGYLDATEEEEHKNVIQCTEGCKSEANTAEEATEEKAPQNEFLINASDKKNIIVCTSSEGCSTIVGNSDTTGNKYYPYSVTNENIIKCEHNAECATDNHAGADGKAYYINGYEDKYVLACDTTDGCVTSFNLATADQPSYYVDSSADNQPLIITCTPDKCTSGPGSTLEGTAYKDPIDAKNVIICESETAACTAPAAGAGDSADTYIDAGDLSQIISCNDTACSYIATKPVAFNSEYYARFAEGVAEIIECDFNTTSTKKSICKLDTETAVQPNAVFRNALFGKENGDATNPLIICDNESKCAPSTVTVSEFGKSYYINSDVQSVNKTLNNDIIECTEESKECTLMNGSNTSVYLNANFDADNNPNQLIICRTNGGCLEQKANSTADDLHYFVNAGSVVKTALNETLIECNESTCEILTTVEDSNIFIDQFDTSHTIQCYQAQGCKSTPSRATDKKNEIFLNSSDLVNSEDPLTKDLIKCVNTEGTITCSAMDGAADEVYVNAHNNTEIIYCTDEDGCKSKASGATATQPEYYVNADPTDVEKLNGDLIKCKSDGSKVICEVTYGNDGDVFLNANYENDSAKKPLIMCSAESGCATDASKTTDKLLPAYYVNAGSVLSSKLNDTLIQCTYETNAECSIKVALQNEVYVNSANNTVTNPLIKCNANGCKVSISSATEKSKEYYVNAGDGNEKPLEADIIECVSGEEGIECSVLEKANEGVYVNSNYSENGDAKQLIQCRKDTGCAGIKTSPSNSEYFVNAEATDLNNAIIFCANKKCEKQTPTGVPTYYVGSNGDSQEDQVNGLIECTESEPADDTPSRRKRATEKKCKLKPAFTSNGYYLNSGYNKSVNQTILCDSSEGCATEKVILGYYVNAGDATKPVIKCEKEGTECVEEESKECPSSFDIIPGNYCYSEGSLKFYPSSNSTAISASKSDDIYTFATIPANGFPGIKSETGALFKISRYYINRFYQSGVVMIDKNGKLVDNLSAADQSDISVYDCNDSTKMCTERSGCTSNTYMFDSENKKAVFCNNNKLEYAEFTGYVVDGNRAVGTNHPYIIHCENNGSKCESIKPKVSSYYENNGYDSSANGLIECSGNNCITVGATVGYYVGHEGKGIIQCTSSTSCVYADSKSKVKYVNAGSNKSSNAIISCTKDSCVSTKANTGYYLTYTSTLLIQCTNPSNCVEFTPSVNYYDNADSSESSNTIINCVQNSQVITCSTEATNSGFYISSTPNVLIRCKSGNKCKTVTVKNGIFRGAIKSNTSGSKRSDDEKESQVESQIESDIEVEGNDDGKSVVIPRGSDDSYDIIRCIQEKCSALSPSEVSAIPICEFNNNKCYITNEYAMTKSATTSISAGSICTNNDRSVFYFATDTVVVKPNVISGSTTTYIYTTTNSNCLEVNDSYSDMYFTVGSNIYLLDQGSVLQFYEQGYYFINTAKNAIVGGSDIDNYNDKNVKLYRCNGSSCSILDKPDSLTFYADVNKRILRYNVNSGSYSFAYEKDIICIFANNKCTPNADLKNQEFCITYKGELALAKADIKNRETGECYKASSLSSTIYGYSQSLYSMNLYSAEMIDETGYYIVSLSTNTTVVSKNYKTKNNKLVIYGCQLSSCKEIEPEEDTYYYDSRAKTILRYKDGAWKTPETSGYAYISIDPVNTYIYRFTKINDEVKINGIANYGYYYTVDGEMYNCNQDEGGACTPINNTGYYFTNAGEVYYCVHDSENLEPTECTKQACISGQYYYIDEAYYRCESSSSLVPVMSRYCSYNENVIINFPLALTEEYPDKIKQAVEGIEKNNNSTAIIRRSGKNYLESVSGIFTNCTYNVEETKSTFDLVCVNNFVKVDEETDDVKICSIEKLGYVECTEEEENPEKCNVSFGISRASLSILSVVLTTVIVVLFNERH